VTKGAGRGLRKTNNLQRGGGKHRSGAKGREIPFRAKKRFSFRRSGYQEGRENAKMEKLKASGGGWINF